VSDSSTLHLRTYTLAEGRFMSVWFDPQTYEGLRVVRSRLSVWMDSAGVLAMDGNYYPEICVPDAPLVDAAQAQDLIIGLEIVHRDQSDDPHTFEVTSDSFLGEPEKLILVHELTDAIELRVAWGIPVGPLGDNNPWWIVYVDTMDGENLDVDQLVIF